jgi:pyrroloquinoline quinone biosynthesis protein D
MAVLALTAIPRLADKARLRTDQKTGETLLLYPEAGLKLNGSGAEVLRRCTGANSIAAIVDELGAFYPNAERGLLEREVLALLTRLWEKGLIALAT